MSKFEHDYRRLLATVATHGEHRPSRAGFTVGCFGMMLHIDCLEEGRFPLLTQRKVHTAGVLGELAAFLRGATDLQTFKDFGCNYWDANAAAWLPNQGVPIDKQIVGHIYGAQWRNWASEDGAINQVERLVRSLQQDPYGRRHLLTTYNPAELDKGCLPPCHLLTQFNVRTSQRLDCAVTMRSVDLCLGLPSDIILYAALLLILCNETGYRPGKLTFMLGDTHIYRNHLDTLQEHAARPMLALPTYSISPAATVDSFVPSDLTFIDYKHSGVLNYAFNV